MIDVRIVGGGPAGCSAAIHLARAGFKVRLYEQAQFPRAKLCGGYLSAEALPELVELGIWDAVMAAGAHPTTRVLVSTPSGAQAQTRLSAPAYSLSRYHLDQVLLKRALACGVDVVHRRVVPQPDAQEAPYTIIAAGRAFRHDSNIAPIFYGLQAFFTNIQGVSDQIELDLIPGGYIGLVRQDEAVNVCGLVTLKTLRQAGPDLDQALSRFAETNPLLRLRLAAAVRAGDWLTVGPVRIGRRRLTEGPTFFVGDAACIVDPFAGEGVAMGLATGRVVREAFAAPDCERSARYERLWHARFDSAIRLQRMICWAVEKPWWQETMVHICRLFPPVMRKLTEATRPPLPKRAAAVS